MEETIEQKIIRNVQGHFAIFKTPEVVGSKSRVPNIEWEDGEDIDKFFMFAKNLGAKVIYLTEGEEEDEATGQIKSSILQIGFLYDGIMHHINFMEEEDEEDEDEDAEEEDEEDETPITQVTPTPRPNNQFIGGGINQQQGQYQQQTPQNQFGGQTQQAPPQQSQQYNQQQNNF